MYFQCSYVWLYLILVWWMYLRPAYLSLRPHRTARLPHCIIAVKHCIYSIRSHHSGKRGEVVVGMKNIYGMLILFGLGVCGALTTFIAENVLSVSKTRDNDKSSFVYHGINST